MAIDLKKKLGPLPVWAWAGLGVGTLGIAYYLHERNASSSATTSTSTVDPNTIDPSTGIPWSQEYEALQNSDGADTGGGTGSSGGIDTTGLATGTTTTDQLAQDLQAIQDEISSESAAAGVGTGAGATTIPFGQEITDVTGAISALGSAGLIPMTTTASATGSTPAAAAKSVAGLTILAQLQDLAAGLVTKSQLGPNATAQLAATNGNVSKAIAARESTLTKTAAAPVTRATTTKVSKAAEDVGKAL